MKKNILILDDSTDMRNLLSMFLSKKYEITTFSSGLEAFKWIQDGNMPDVIVSDISMPEMNGEQFLTMIKNSGVFRHIPVIILSSINNSDKRIKMLEEGADDYLVKPFNPVELSIRLEKCLTRQSDKSFTNQN